MKKLILIILDGWGLSKNNLIFSSVSAIEKAHTPFIDYCYKIYPWSKLSASGLSVGLPKGQMGNSEIGHMNLGSGRKIIQNLEKINFSIKMNSLKEKINFIFDYILYSKKQLHLIGLLSDGGIHSHINHLFYLIKIAHRKNIKKIFIHAFTDGRDTSPTKGLFFIKKLLMVMKNNVGKLASVIGRYYSMDRDNRWDRTKKAYDAMVTSKGIYVKNILEYLNFSYKKGKTDEFLSPVIITDLLGKPITRIKKGDVVLSFNFRSDRMRQITELLTNNLNKKNFFYKKIQKLNLYYITMTCYNDKYKNVYVIFKKKNLIHTLGEILESEGKKQIRIAETEKYPHVTFFFSGGREKPFDGEIRILCDSPKVSTYDLQPKMSAKKIVDKIVPELRRKKTNFICLNFANPDMVGHTGKMGKTIQACEFVDKCVKICSEEAIRNDYSIIIVGDHGNADYMINMDGSPNTNHSNALVPFILIDSIYNKKNFLRKKAILSDVAPTILQLLNLKKPSIMNGRSIIKKNIFL
ncbi:2,3-bisphosphoglycerate-independent phosphoglycerate mutase [Blattabacterium cuenoti]|uniref:2,3-bisphosphoglycerate-independent phosphoglycerate mutase n=1 Tax=Blattabacterium cuenoti TaxID=1653831 RepID=UPI00163C0E2C|nr:2,3-bisphosphoglycerate-independent phosphoglycerate mutase [Blattabacterium cuenoti]